MVHLVMFDMDGTLVDSTGFNEECFLKDAEILFGVEISSEWDSYEYATDIGILEEVSIEMPSGIKKLVKI